MPSARIVVDPAYTVGPLNRRLFGSFVEHLGRCVYDGIYEPGHRSADADGFRSDVMDLVRELGVTTVRYPGGNFVSGYRWEDGVGPRGRRPQRLDLAWHSLETNQVGLHEFAGWCERQGVELMLALNLGTRGVLEALDLLEYANISAGSALADLRAANGSPEPFGVRMWCLGNEMDGPWQLGHRSAEDYGKIASRAASAMRQLDPGLELVVCGSSSRSMPTFGTWERVVLEHCYDDVDFISCHAYYQQREGDRGSFLASAVDMEAFIEAVIATADSVKAARRSERRIAISFDEWNVWYSRPLPRERKDYRPGQLAIRAPAAGRPVLGNRRGGGRQPAHLFAEARRSGAGRMSRSAGQRDRPDHDRAGWAGVAANHLFSVRDYRAPGLWFGAAARRREPELPDGGVRNCAALDAVATIDHDTGSVAVFLVHRGMDAPITVSIDVGSLEPVRLGETTTLADHDPTATNTLQHQQRVVPSPNQSARIASGVLTVDLPPISWTALELTPL